MFGPKRTPDPAQAFVFPDWSPYGDLGDAVRAYFRDPEIALTAIEGALGPGAEVAGFTLERMVGDDGMVWQEAAICDGRRLLLWHGEDVAESEFPGGAMTSAIRTIPLERVTEVGYRQLITRDEEGGAELHGVDVYILLESLDEAGPSGRDGESNTVIRHDAIRLGKTAEAGGAGQMDRLTAFAHLVAGLTGAPAEGLPPAPPPVAAVPRARAGFGVRRGRQPRPRI
jgi:hypothetical protein